MNNAYHQHRAALASCAACNGSCLDGACECCTHDEAPAHPAEACTDIGADDCRQPFTRLGVALVMLPWVLGVIGWAVWTRWPLF